MIIRGKYQYISILRPFDFAQDRRADCVLRGKQNVAGRRRKTGIKSTSSLFAV
jgi:hypothetical protein